MKIPIIFEKVKCEVEGFEDNEELLKTIAASWKRIKGKRRKLIFPSTLKISNNTHKDTIAYWINNTGGDRGTLSVNPNHYFWGDLTAIDDHLLISGVDGLFCHELGHLHHFKMNFRTYVDPILFTESERKMVREQVSPYAGTNSREFIAEVFSGKLNDKYFSRSINILYKKMIYGRKLK